MTPVTNAIAGDHIETFHLLLESPNLDKSLEAVTKYPCSGTHVCIYTDAKHRVCMTGIMDGFVYIISV